MIYMTGDTHRDFERIFWFCKSHATTKEDDIMIILGDAGINYYGGRYDRGVKEMLSALPLTFFCLHGNHEMRPHSVGTYKVKPYHGDQVYYEQEYPNILFAIDGGVYNFNGLDVMTIGGAYSVDKEERLEAMMCGFDQYKWFADEQPSQEIKDFCERILENRGNQVDVMLTHTCPMSDRPVHAFLPSVDQSAVDTSTEEWLEKLQHKIRVLRWYAGHYHVDERMGNTIFLYKDIIAFPTKEELYVDDPIN